MGFAGGALALALVVVEAGGFASVRDLMISVILRVFSSLWITSEGIVSYRFPCSFSHFSIYSF